jgi:hypothetical protein
MPPSPQQSLAFVRALSPDQVRRLDNAQYIASIRQPPKFVQGPSPYGVSKSLALPDPANALKPDQRFLEPGLNLEQWPDTKPQAL